MVDLTPDLVDHAVSDAAGFAEDRVNDVAHGVAGLGGFVAKTAEGAWDLATDPIEAIYAEARRGVSLLRQGLAEVADLATHPVGDAASLRTAAAAWAATADALGRGRRSIDVGGRSLAATWKGPNGDAHLDGIRATGDALGEVEDAARQVQRLLERGAGTVDDLNREVQHLVAETAAWIGVSMVVGLITGGGGLVLGTARVARTVTRVKALVAEARTALVALRVAEAVRVSAIGFKLRATAQLTVRGRTALAGAEKLAAATRAAKASKVGAGLAATGRGARAGLGRAARSKASPVSTAKRKIAFGSATASSAASTALAKDPSQWTAEDIARMVAGGYLTAVHGDRLTELLKGRTRLGEVGRAAVQSATFGVAGSAGTQAAFNGGRIDPTTAGLAGLTGGAGGALGRRSVRSALEDAKAKGSSGARQEAIKADGRLGVEALGEGRLQDRVRGLRGGADATTTTAGGLVVPATPRLRVPRAPILHTIRPGESLWSIAGDRLHDPEVWRRIRQANPGLTDPDLIRPGDRVAIPRGLGFRPAA